MEQTSRAINTLISELTNVPHRNYGPMVSRLKQAMLDDPQLISRFCMWSQTGANSVRDLTDSAIIVLLTADPAHFGKRLSQQYRRAGRTALLGNRVYNVIGNIGSPVPGLDVFRVLRIAKFIRSRYVIVNLRDKENQHEPPRSPSVINELARFPSMQQAKKRLAGIARKAKVNKDSLEVGNFTDQPRSPRLMTAIMQDFLNSLQYENKGQFDKLVILNRKELKEACRYYRLKLTDRAKGILFCGEWPGDSRYKGLNGLHEVTNLTERAKRLIEAQVPWSVVSGYLPTSPQAAIVLVDVGTPRQLINARSQFENHGWFEIDEVKQAYLDKISQKDARRSVATIRERKSVQGRDEQVQAVLDKQVKKAVKEDKPIEGDVLLGIDVSSSMHDAIAMLPAIVGRVFPLIQGKRRVVAFNGSAWHVKVNGDSMQDGEAAASELRAGGMTSFERLLQAGVGIDFQPDRVVIVTDGQETSGTIERGLDRLTAEPAFTVVMMDGGRKDNVCQRIESRFPLDVIQANDGYYWLDQLASVLGGSKRETLIDVIRALPLLDFEVKR